MIKKYTLLLGAISMVNAPLILSISCSDNSKDVKNEDERALDSFLENITDVRTTAFQKYASSFQVGSNVSGEQIGVEWTTAFTPAITIVLKVVAADTQNSSLTIEVNVSLNNKSKTKTVTINGFARENNANAIIVRDEINALPESIVTNSSDVKAGEFDNIINEIVEASDLGINLISSSDALFTFKVLSSNKTEGSLDIEVRVAKLSEWNTKKVKVTGYTEGELSNEEQLQVVGKKLKKSYNTNKLSIKASTLGKVNDELSIEELGIDENISNKLGVSYTFIFKDVSDYSGVIVADLRISKNNASYTKTNVNIKGFRKLMSDEQLIDTAMNSLKPIYTTSKTNELPTAVASKGQSVTAAQLGVSVDIGNYPGVDWEVVVENNAGSVNNTMGEIIVSVTATWKTQTRTKTGIVIKGFKSNNENMQAVLNYMASLSNIYATGKFNQKPTELGFEINSTVNEINLGIRLPARPSDIVIDMAAWEFNDIDGTIEVNIRVFKGYIGSNKLITVVGYNSINKEHVVANYSRMNDVFETTHTNITAVDSTLQVNHATTTAKLGITFVPTDGVVVTYQIIGAWHELGKVQVVVTFSKGHEMRTKYINVTGFKIITK